VPVLGKTEKLARCRPATRRHFPTSGCVPGMPTTSRRYCGICLHFDIVDVYRVSLIDYPSQDGGLVNEVLRFDGDRIREGHGTHLQ
jgi:hypothetical protein